jgi:hypothetical protein
MLHKVRNLVTVLTVTRAFLCDALTTIRNHHARLKVL